jgi:hypothetical protein
MTVEGAVAAEFSYYFRSLLSALGDRPGWYGAFARRDPEAAADYGSGRRLPPWDVVRTVLRDVAVNAGAQDADPAEAGRAYALHRAAAAAEDAAPGAAAELRRRLDAALRARDRAAARAAHGEPAGGEPARAADERAWARDDLARASARCEELRGRLLAVAGTTEVVAAGVPAVRRPTGARFAGAGAGPPEAPAAEPSARVRSAAPRGARFAGAPTAPAPVEAAPAAPPAPSGARFAGAPTSPAAPAAPPGASGRDPRWTAQAQAAAARLGVLRRAGESGAAYLVLCATAEGPADRIPYVIRELERTGLAADVSTLLWETAALPPVPLAEAAAALAADGRAPDCRTLLRQAAARSAEDVAVVAETLHLAGRAAEAGELLETLARSRPAATAAATARVRPALAQPLLAAAARVSRSCHREISAALYA